MDTSPATLLKALIVLAIFALPWVLSSLRKPDPASCAPLLGLVARRPDGEIEADALPRGPEVQDAVRLGFLSPVGGAGGWDEPQAYQLTKKGRRYLEGHA